MTPKEKAEELYSKFYYTIPIDEMNKDEEAAKQCALIAVDELIRADWQCEEYWKNVKQEIENL